MNTSFNFEYVGDYFIFSYNQPFQNILTINGYEETIDGNGSLLKEFRWGTDGESYSQWISLSNMNLNSYIPKEHYDCFWIEIRYELINSIPTSVSNVNLSVEYIDNTLSGFYPYNVLYSIKKGNRFNPIKNNPFSWNPYEQNNIIKLHQDLNLIINNIYGHEVSYIKVNPITNSRDVILGEWTIYNAQDPKCIKIVVPDNAFPDNKFKFDQFGMDFEIPFIVQVDKRAFEEVFGYGMAPQKLDAIYFPINSRMYDIESSELVRSFMQRPSYWEISLVKHQNIAQVRKSVELTSELDKYTTGIDKLLGAEIKKELKDITNSQQLEKQTNFKDNIREFLDYRINDVIVQETIQNSHTTISQYHYDFGLKYLDDSRNVIIRYKVEDTFSLNENRVFTCWFKEIDFKTYIKKISSVQVIDNTYKINFEGGIPNILLGDQLKIYIPNTSFSVFGKIVEIDTINLYVIIIVDDYILNIANTILPNWILRGDLLSSKLGYRNLIFNYNEYTNKGYRIDIFDSKYINIFINGISNWFIIPVLLKQWYAIVINMLNTYNQISVHLYERADNSLNTTKLSLLYKNVINNIPAVDRTSEIKYDILISPLCITNVRILNEVLEPEEHSIFLNQNIINDSSKAILIDNALPRYFNTKIGDPK